MKHNPPVVLAAFCHPDDIEFMAAGTLLRLRQAGCPIHMWNLANGCLGSVEHSKAETIRLRWQEAQDSAKLAGATLHTPLFDDLAVFFDQPSLARVAAVIRDINPAIVLTHSPVDYMEDHTNTCRLVVTAVFARGMPNFNADPVRPPRTGDVAVYHALPHTLRGPLLEPVTPHAYVDVTGVLAEKRALLACHRSQKQWLDVSQGMDSYLQVMEDNDAKIGRMSGRLKHAEGWRRHNPAGFGPDGWNPLKELLQGNYYEPGA
jgi:LmbE family N-acetylglucosaminyl deacetylase